ncbi:hypothetical protein OEZ85_007493 [Tetradesmus obliquus]|uniref:Uncharacterized protein n=1 Tax=Tetradesmus obliquus TaxID=3088 RepID=A0ABY8TG47_TETOB|nr:hypothetical protein OEZ85_007493 [Tetradesmus obliquus]
MRGLGLSMLTLWVCFKGILDFLNNQLHGTPVLHQFAALLLPVARLAWVLVEAAAAAAAAAAAGGSSRRAPAGVLAAAVMPTPRKVEHVRSFAAEFGQYAVSLMAADSPIACSSPARLLRQEAIG